MEYIEQLEVAGMWRKTFKYGNTYEVLIAYDDFCRCIERGITINSMIGWSIEDALRKLNERLEPWNIKVTSLTKSLLSED